MLNYGSIFDFIRWNKFVKYAHRIGRSDLILMAENPDLDETLTTPLIKQIAAHRISYYNIVAAYSKNFKLWVCTECMSIRICLFLNLIVAFIFSLMFNNAIELLNFIPFSIFSTAFIYNLIFNADE